MATAGELKCRGEGIVRLSSTRRNFAVQFLEPLQHDIDLFGDGGRIGAQN